MAIHAVTNLCRDLAKDTLDVLTPGLETIVLDAEARSTTGSRELISELLVLVEKLANADREDRQLLYALRDLGGSTEAQYKRCKHALRVLDLMHGPKQTV